MESCTLLRAPAGSRQLGFFVFLLGGLGGLVGLVGLVGLSFLLACCATNPTCRIEKKWQVVERPDDKLSMLGDA